MAQPDRLVLPNAKTGSRELLEAVRRGEMRLLAVGRSRYPGGHLILVMRAHLPGLDDGLMDPASAWYTIRINGHLGATVLSAFPALVSQRHDAHTVLTGVMDRAALYGVLAEIEALGLDLIEVRRLVPPCESPESGDSRSP